MSTAVVVLQLRKGPRPEEQVARTFVEAMLEGRADDAYQQMSNAYRSLVFPAEHRTLVDVLSRMVGDDADVEILGSERTPGTEPLESLVGYEADTAAGPLEGVVTLYRVDDGWVVGDWSYDFVDPPAGATDELVEVTRRLNTQIAERVGNLQLPRDDGSPSPRSTS